MPKLLAIPIQSGILNRVFVEWNLWELIGNGTLISQEIDAQPAKNIRYAGGTSRISKHYTANGIHVATTHRIDMPDGTTPHHHAKDLRVDIIRMIIEVEPY